MNGRLPHLTLILLLAGALGGGALAARAPIPERTGAPYRSALAINAGTGEVFFEDNSGAEIYPASLVKLMVLLIIQEKIEQGALRLEDQVQVSAEAARIGGSQVYLAENEVFSIEDLLYALIIQSANDSAAALAIHVAGSQEAFTRLMQDKARELGMADTVFRSVHGLPPAGGQEPDTTTARDLARLALELTRHPDIFRYTSAVYRTFREGTFEMRTHNRLLGTVEGCDGLKTGFFKAGGFSIVASAKRRGVRFIAIVLGSKERTARDAKARELLAQAFSSTVLPPPTPDRPLPTPTAASTPEAAAAAPVCPASGGCPGLYLVPILAVVAGLFFWLGRRRRQ